MEQSRVDWPAFITCVVIILVVCIPLALTAEFHADAAKQTQWRAFLRKGSVAETAELEHVVSLIAAFVMPAAAAV